MELPQSMQDALSLAGESIHIPDAQFPSFVEVAFRGVINSNERNAIENLKGFTSKDPAAVKEAYAGLVAMVIEAAKQDADIESLSSLLEDCKFPPERIKEVSETYQKNKPALQILLGSVGRTPAHIVDVDWRLDYYVKNNHMEKVNEAVYLITLKTELIEIMKAIGSHIIFDRSSTACGEIYTATESERAAGGAVFLFSGTASGSCWQAERCLQMPRENQSRIED